MLLPLLYTHWVYAVIFACAFIASSVSELAGPAGHRAGRKYQQKDPSLVILNSSAAIGILLFFVLPLVVPMTTVMWSQPLLFGLGLVFLLLGMALRRVAMGELGRFFVGVVTIQEDHSVVSTGPYRIVRHPAYTGILLGAVGNGLMMTNWASLLAIVGGMAVGLFFRIRAEEKALQSIQGYEEYQKRVRWCLVPFLL